ncbi:propanediol utilization microcompartment protein PduB [Lacrimispora sp.]|uniref:propanediol utilization microcompartment protein PduB n=1 Tax=Lacrimispora sp. TaxID=2719234 RepID=UPI0032E502D5
MDKDLLDKILSSVTGSENKEQTTEKVETTASSQCNLTEFVGAGIGDTVGLVIANLEYHLHENLKLDPKYRSIGIVSSRTGGAPHVMSADEAVKATNTEVVSVEFCRDTKGGAGHGSTIIFAAEDVSDARRAVEIMLSALDRNFGNVYGCDAGHIELHYTARASYALNKAFNAPIGKAFGITVGAPAAVGLLMADMAMKTANVDIVTYASPASGTCFSNEIIVTFSGDSGAVRQSVLAARDVGLSVLRGMGQNPVSVTTPTL